MAKMIFLIGMPAAGKTFWGSRVAAEYGLRFVDLDTLITEKEDASVSSLFGTYGEEIFRKKESMYLRQAIATAGEDTIVACGGGTPCFHDNMETMKKAGCVIYLQADVPTLLEHLSNSAEVRPLLQGHDAAQYLANLLRTRSEIYEQAHHILYTHEISIATFAKIISVCTNKQ